MSEAPKECKTCDGTGIEPDPSACGDIECCYPFNICIDCNGEGFVNEE